MEDERELMNKIKRDFPEVNVNVKIKTIQIKCVKVNENENDIKGMCLICRDDTKMKVSCNHYFHEECINEWIKRSDNELCPYCRKVIEFKITNTINEINWERISNYQKLSEKFIREF